MSLPPGITPEQLREDQERKAVNPEVVREAMAGVSPSWTMVQRTDDGAMFRRGNVQVILSVAREDDGHVWMHVSAAARAAGSLRLPTWEELRRVKHDFIGDDRWAYQVLPAEREYVNINPHVLHLFSRMDRVPALPDFTSGLGTI